MAETTTTGGASVILQPFEKKIRRTVIVVGAAPEMRESVLGALVAFAHNAMPATITVDGQTSTLEIV